MTGTEDEKTEVDRDLMLSRHLYTAIMCLAKFVLSSPYCTDRIKEDLRKSIDDACASQMALEFYVACHEAEKRKKNNE